MKKKLKPQERIIKFFEEIDWLFNLNNFNKYVSFLEKDDDKKNAVAEIIYNEAYQDVTINIYPCFFKETLKEQRKILLHELCHSITLPSKTLAHKFIDEGKAITADQVHYENEKATSKIENILNGLLSDRLQYARNAYKNYLK